MSVAWGVARAMRPAQWVKNGFIFAPLFFAQKVNDSGRVVAAALAFAAFCAAASAVYLLNDVIDRDFDREHPEKASRPIASGLVPASVALWIALLLAVAALGGAFALKVPLGLAVTFYLVLNVAYSLKLKEIVILDVFIVSLGFVIRVFAGAIAIDVAASSWLLACTIFLALFLAVAKRRGEITEGNGTAARFRQILGEYDVSLLDQLTAITAALALVSYALYTLDHHTVERLGPNLVFTLPIVAYGIFRYLYLVHRHGKGGSPTRVVLTDPHIVLSALAWGGATAIIIYL
ncbi:MAG: decaprenyl-phosphate phosphoribosyltransferase [Deltaproteobacteria bacterium]|nr:decaprenyl-phosphate phosphoribosyltransferase [Deltaproteobacteria bacterium]